jgi:hypothetical protein
VVEGVVVEVGVPLGEESSVLLALGVAIGSSTTDRKFPTKMAEATIAISATASTPMIRPRRRLRDGWRAGSSFPGSVGVEPLAGGLASPARRGSSVVKLDHREPFQ